MVPLGLRLLALRDMLPGWVPEAPLHGHHRQSPCPRSPTEPLHFPAVARGPATALSLSRNHLTGRMSLLPPLHALPLRHVF